MKALIISTLCALLIAASSVLYFDASINPDFLFFKDLASKSDTWAAKLRENGKPCYITAGGSAGRSGINPQIIHDEYAINLINANGNAGYGMMTNIQCAFHYAKPGDTILLTLEQYAAHKLLNNPSNGPQYGFSRLGINYFNPILIPLDVTSMLSIMKGNSYTISVYVAKKIFLPDMLYLYRKHSIIHPSGWMEITIHSPHILQQYPLPSRFELKPLCKNKEEKQVYAKVLLRAKQEEVKMIAIIPHQYSHPSSRLVNAWQSLELMRLGISVIKDPLLASVQDKENFADRTLHYNKKGAIIFTRFLAKALQEQSFWSEQELIDILNGYGRDAQGKIIP